MRHYNAHHNEDGFSLLELIVIVVFVGIIAAISAPSFIGLNQRNKVSQDLTSAENALLEAQRGAMRRGQNCVLSFSAPSVTPPTISSSSGNCLSQGMRTLYNVTMQVSTANTTLPAITDTTSSSLTFNYLGQINSLTTIVLQHKSKSGDKKCIVISSPLGLIATGKYTGTSTTDIQSNCTP